jgi:hypothetical protein
MNNIVIYDSEKKAGLVDTIREQASIAYASPVCAQDQLEASVLDSCRASISKFLSKAGHKDEDVYHTYSILVTSSWNRNDDVFAKGEIWSARSTPQYKPANLEHDEKKIIGSIIGSWPVNANFDLIDDDTTIDQLPDPYHILVSSVIYKQWQDPEYRSRAEELISKIENGSMFVSMECIFKGFDYAIKTPELENHIVSRSEETAFLSKHLRAYGGTGEYEGHQIGRLLRNITFSGKGFVEKPANPDSVIFDKEHLFDFAGASTSKNLFSASNGVSVRVEQDILSNTGSEEEIPMSSDFLSEQVKELKAALSASKEEVKELANKVSAANVEKLETETVELTRQVASLNESLVEANSKVSEGSEKIEALEATITELTEGKEEAEANVAEMREKERQSVRASALIEAGIAEDEVQLKLETFSSLSDEQFNEVVKTISEFNVKDDEDSDGEETKAEQEVDATADTEEAEAEFEEVDEEVLETASVEEEADLSVASDSPEDDTEHVRAGLQSWVDSYVFNKDSE